MIAAATDTTLPQPQPPATSARGRATTALAIRAKRLMEEGADASPDALRNALDALAVAVTPLVRRYASLIPPDSTGADADDYMQVALMNLPRYVAGFDPDCGRAFTTYLGKSLRNEMWRAYVNSRQSVRVPEYQFGDLASSLCVSIEAVTIPGRLPDPSAYEFDDLERLNSWLAALTPRRRDILHRRFHLGRTRPEIADELGYSTRWVRDLEFAALDDLRRLAGVDVAADGPPEVMPAPVPPGSSPMDAAASSAPAPPLNPAIRRTARERQYLDARDRLAAAGLPIDARSVATEAGMSIGAARDICLRTRGVPVPSVSQLEVA